MSVVVNEEFMIPLVPGQAVGRGWLKATDHQPKGVTWHWTAGRDLAACRRVLGGAEAERKGQASAHYGVGRTLAEGIDCYVSLENRSWHAGVNQTLRWDGRRCTADFKGARATIGVETVNAGFARDGFPAASDWVDATTTNGKHVCKIQPWTDDQVAMMVQVGREIRARWPHISPEDHHGHHDVCPGYKEDVIGFPFARVLRGIYDDQPIADVWTPFLTPSRRQRALVVLDYDLGSYGPSHDGVDGDWGRVSDAALLRFQTDSGMVANGMWTTFVCRELYQRLEAAGVSPSDLE